MTSAQTHQMESEGKFLASNIPITNFTGREFKTKTPNRELKKLSVRIHDRQRNQFFSTPNEKMKIL